MPVEEKDTKTEPKTEVKTKTIEAKPMTKKFAKCKISHGHNPHLHMDPATGHAKTVCDQLVIEAGAEIPQGFDPAEQGLEEGVHWYWGR
jgi:hypothetical protein